MGAAIPHDLAWRSSHYHAVYGVLADFLDSDMRHLTPGIDGVLGRAQSHFDRLGDRATAIRLAGISLLVFRLRQALMARADADYAALRTELAARARDWLLSAPLFPEHPPLELVA